MNANDTIKQLREASEFLSAHSLDRGVQEAGIAANLAERAADTIESLLAALKACVESMSNDHPGSDEYWRTVAAAEAIAKAEGRSCAEQIPYDEYLTVADPAVIDQAWERYRASTDTTVKASEVNTEAFDYLTKTTEG